MSLEFKDWLFWLRQTPNSHSNSGPTPVNSAFWFTPCRRAGSHCLTNHHLNTQYLGLGSSFSLEAAFYFLLVFLEQNRHFWIEKRRSGQEIKLFATTTLKVLIKIKIKIYIKNMIYAPIKRYILLPTACQGVL